MNSQLARLQQLANQAPEHPLLEDEHGPVCAAEILARVKEVALQLQAMDISRIGLFCDNSVDWVVADLACQFEGICLVPVPTFFSDSQVRHVVDSAALEALLYDRSTSSRVAFLFGAGKGVPLASARVLQCMALAPAKQTSMPAATAKLTFTSGSTGTPKGVCLSAPQCLRVAESLAKAVELDSPRHLCVLPLSTLLENIGGIYMPLLCGGTSLVYSLESLGMSGSSGVQPDKFLGALERLQPETLILVPQLLMLLDTALAQGWQAPGSLRFIAVGGGRVAPAVVARVRDAGLPVYEGYGLSESASVVSLNTPQADRPGTSGRVLPHVAVKQQGGELVVSGNTFLGYLDEPSTWESDSVQTGDLGYISEDGYLTVQGRRKNVLVSSFGRNISPEWVESELLAEVGIDQVVLVGDGRPYCAALVYSRKDDESIARTLDKVNHMLPDYARILSWHRLQEPLSVANGLLTDNGRLRRDAIAIACEHEINSLYFEQVESFAL